MMPYTLNNLRVPLLVLAVRLEAAAACKDGTLGHDIKIGFTTASELHAIEWTSVMRTNRGNTFKKMQTRDQVQGAVEMVEIYTASDFLVNIGLRKLSCVQRAVSACPEPHAVVMITTEHMTGRKPLRGAQQASDLDAADLQDII